ncbi:MAG TPA: glycosyltransferase family 9 protein [Candidatus Competibacter sp.]|nr:glycosyl transferase family 1 [Candidatus Competibacteraceae bacterium]HRE55242.1 glycosyltransferase family 9 protein [Candidatus Competibacter sp.]
MKLAPSGRTLVVQPLPGIGDMVWHLPYIHAIATTTYSGRVDILTKPRSLAHRLLDADPSVERVFWLERDSGRHAGASGLLRLAALLRKEAYQRVWVLHGSARYALATWLAGIPERIGYGIGLQRWLLNGPARLSAGYRLAQPMARADALMALLGLQPLESEPRLTVAAAAEQTVADLFAAWPKPWIALGIGSSEPYKQWGAQRFSELALALARTGHGSVVVVGGPTERVMADAILARVIEGGGAAADAVALPLEHTAALLAGCRCYIGNDTGALNMAAALQVPSFGLFGGSPPLTHSPFIQAIVPADLAGGMAAITVHQVLEALAWLDRPDDIRRAPSAG